MPPGYNHTEHRCAVLRRQEDLKKQKALEKNHARRLRLQEKAKRDENFKQSVVSRVRVQVHMMCGGRSRVIALLH